MQDNDPKHTSNAAKQRMLELGVNWWRTPPESPDLNPIENIWHALKDYLRMEVKPRNAEQLVTGIREYWSKLSVETCVKYIGHLRKVIPAVVEADGKASGY